MKKLKSYKSYKRKERKTPNNFRSIVNNAIKYKTVNMPSVTGRTSMGITVVYPKNLKKAFNPTESVFKKA